jgi:hypothetical protein
VTQLPTDLLAALPDGSSRVATDWWAALSETDRQRLAELWDERLEVKFFSPQTDDAGYADKWDEVPAVRGGRFIPHDDDGRGEWGPGYFEHLLQHPELVLAYEPQVRTFHIGCTRHAAARACLANGEVPVGFVCPVAEAGCPLEVLRGSRLVHIKSVCTS